MSSISSLGRFLAFLELVTERAFFSSVRGETDRGCNQNQLYVSLASDGRTSLWREYDRCAKRGRVCIRFDRFYRRINPNHRCRCGYSCDAKARVRGWRRGLSMRTISLMTTNQKKRLLTVAFCKSRVTAPPQTRVRSAIPWICELNLAEMAQNVSSNDANAADCKQRRKCLTLGEIFLYGWDGYFYALECFH